MVKLDSIIAGCVYTLSIACFSLVIRGVQMLLMQVNKWCCVYLEWLNSGHPEGDLMSCYVVDLLGSILTRLSHKACVVGKLSLSWSVLILINTKLDCTKIVQTNL